MKYMKSYAAFASLALVALLTTAVWAGPGGGMGPGHGRGMAMAQLTPEQQAALEKDRAAFLTETEGLRKEMATKAIELRTLQAQANPDPAKVRALSDELVDLGAQVAKKHNAYMSKYPGMGAGCGMMGGMGGGHGRMGGGMGMGLCGR